MKIGPPTGEGKDLRITEFVPSMGGMGVITMELTWKEWNELVKDANYFRAYGKVRGHGPLRG